MLLFIDTRLQSKTGVYIITNNLDKRVYIGSTRDSFSARYSCHVSRLNRGDHHNPHLQAFYNKYGSDSLLFKALEVIDDLSRIYQREQFYLDQVFASGCAFNIARDAVCSSLGLRRSPATLERMRQARLGSVCSAETCRKIAQANQVKVIQYDLKGKIVTIHSSIKAAAETVPTQPSHITEVCQGRRRVAGGYTWEYYQKEGL